MTIKWQCEDCGCVGEIDIESEDVWRHMTRLREQHDSQSIDCRLGEWARIFPKNEVLI